MASTHSYTLLTLPNDSQFQQQHNTQKASRDYHIFFSIHLDVLLQMPTFLIKFCSLAKLLYFRSTVIFSNCFLILPTCYFLEPGKWFRLKFQCDFSSADEMVCIWPAAYLSVCEVSLYRHWYNIPRETRKGLFRVTHESCCVHVSESVGWRPNRKKVLSHKSKISKLKISSRVPLFISFTSTRTGQ